MKSKIILCSVVSILLSACQTVDPNPSHPVVEGQCPVTPMNDQKTRELCEHFAEEPPYDAERAAFIKRKMDELNCGLYF